MIFKVLKYSKLPERAEKAVSKCFGMSRIIRALGTSQKCLSDS